MTTVWPTTNEHLRWLRDTTTGLRVFVRRLDDGRTEARAVFTYRGEAFDVEAVADADAEVSALDSALRRATLDIGERSGVQRRRDRDAEEGAVVEAALRGDTELAARLGHELVMKNNNVGRGQPVRTTTGKWER